MGWEGTELGTDLGEGLGEGSDGRDGGQRGPRGREADEGLCRGPGGMTHGGPTIWQPGRAAPSKGRYLRGYSREYLRRGGGTFREGYPRV